MMCINELSLAYSVSALHFLLEGCRGGNSRLSWSHIQGMASLLCLKGQLIMLKRTAYYASTTVNKNKKSNKMFFDVFWFYDGYELRDLSRTNWGKKRPLKKIWAHSDHFDFVKSTKNCQQHMSAPVNIFIIVRHFLHFMSVFHTFQQPMSSPPIGIP